MEEEYKETIEAPAVRRPNPFPVLITIVLIVGLAGISLVYSRNGERGVAKDTLLKTVSIKTISKEEHILGSIDAPVKIIVYSDLECPYCKDFHFTMKKAMEEFGVKNQIAWIYRHYILESIHPKAIREAEATECAEELGGNLVFWKYVDRIFEITKSNNSLPEEELMNTAKYLNLDEATFSQCLESGKYEQIVHESIEDGKNAGAVGTPYTIIITKDGRGFPLEGAVKYPKLKEIIQAALRG